MNISRAFTKLKASRMGRLTHRAPLKLADPGQLPKTVYMFWHAGVECAPDLVKYCIESWRQLNPAWAVVVLDSASARSCLEPSAYPAEMLVAHYADVLRCSLLSTKGGVWADATCLCTRPLDTWLPQLMAQSEFFAFRRPSSDRVLSNWFLASTPNAKLMNLWYEQTQRFWDGLSVPPVAYFWQHYLFEYLLLSSAVARSEWGAVPALSATAPHTLQRVLLEQRGPTARESAVISASPVHKLTYKGSFGAPEVASVLSAIQGAPALE